MLVVGLLLKCVHYSRLSSQIDMKDYSIRKRVFTLMH